MPLSHNRISETVLAPPSVAVAIIFGVLTSMNPSFLRNSLHESIMVFLMLNRD